MAFVIIRMWSQGFPPSHIKEFEDHFCRSTPSPNKKK